VIPGLYAAAAALLVGAGGGYFVRDYIADADDARRERQELSDQVRRAGLADRQAEAYERALADARAAEPARAKEEERVAKAPVYLNACLDDDGLRLLADEIRARHTSQPKGPVP
jgi:hypothetical protein